MDGYLKDKYVLDVYLRIYEVLKINKYWLFLRLNVIDDDIFKNNVDRLYLFINFIRRLNVIIICSRIKYY